MYHYPHYRDEDPEHLLSVIQAYPLGLIVSQDGERFAASHIPFMAERNADGGWRLLGHMDSGNPQTATLNGACAYIVFAGPNTYISPTVYATRQLPTWNYIAVHVTGRCRLEVPGLAILDDIERLARQSETSAGGWALDKSETRVRKLAPLITRVTVDVEHIEGRFKLSQEKGIEDRQAVTAHLVRQNPAAQSLLETLSLPLDGKQ
jgi:transcriptional regulator